MSFDEIFDLTAEVCVFLFFFHVVETVVKYNPRWTPTTCVSRVLTALFGPGNHILMKMKGGSF